LRRKACDQVFSDPASAVRDADLVILATPVQSIPKLARLIAPHLKKGCLVTDVGSTKEKLVRELRRLLPKDVHFIGGHPIAGTEHSGMAAAQKGLFQDRWWILTPESKGPSERKVLRDLERCLQQLGAKTALMDPKQHDEILAWVSHLPHLLAYSLVDAVQGYQKGRALGFAGSSFLDGTRVAKSSALMWRDIVLDNRETLLKKIADFKKTLSKVEKLLRQKNGSALERFFHASAEIRRGL